MTKSEIKSFLDNNKGYLKWGKKKLARKFNTTQNIIVEIKQELLKLPINKGFKRLFFDIETSPNIGWFWRSTYNTNISTDQIEEERKVICVSYKWENSDKVEHLFWDENKSDKTLLEKFSKILLQADEVVAHNGDRFDIPWLRTRCLMFGIPFPTYIKSLDTLRKVRSMFNFQSNRLDYIAKFLGLEGKISTSINLWKTVVFKDITSKEYKEALNEMLVYCDYDVILLEDVYKKISSYIKPNTHVGVHNGENKCSCPTCGGTNVKYIKAVVTSAGTIKRQMLCLDDNVDYVISNTAYKNYLKNGN
jgi:hypothetical protein